MTGLGAPSPIWQHTAVTEIRIVGLIFPSLTAETSAVPSPTARATAFGLPGAASIATTRPLELTHETRRSVSVAPLAVKKFTRIASVSPCFNGKIEVE